MATILTSEAGATPPDGCTHYVFAGKIKDNKKNKQDGRRSGACADAGTPRTLTARDLAHAQMQEPHGL